MKTKRHHHHLLLLLLLVPASAFATSLAPMSLQQLTQAATVIVRAHVLDQYSAWDASHKQIHTYTAVAVDQSIKGDSPVTLTVQQPGGAVGNMHEFVPGTVRFMPQGEYMLFLQPASGTPYYLLVGMVQGAYRIYHDATTNQDRVINPMGSLFYGASAGRGRSQAQAHSVAQAQPQTVPLKTFQQNLSTAMAAPIRIPAGAAIAVVIAHTSFAGVGRLDVYARTQYDLFPRRDVVIPAGSELLGAARKMQGNWVIHWQSVMVGGQSVPIHSEDQTVNTALNPGRNFVVQVR